MYKIKNMVHTTFSEESGALNWGLIGLFDFNLVTTLFEEGSIIVKVIYTLIGLCGLIDIGMFFNHLETHE